MPIRSGEEIQVALRRFVGSWRDYSGGERGEAQTFLNELIGCYGSDRRADGARFEDAHTANGIMDMHWPGVCIVEMKAPSRADRLAEHRGQALEYWRTSASAADNRAAPRFVVLCAFRRFEVWEPGRFPAEPRADFRRYHWLTYQALRPAMRLLRHGQPQIALLAIPRSSAPNTSARHTATPMSTG